MDNIRTAALEDDIDLSVLIARTAITDTITRFLRSLDDGDPDLLFSCLTPDMVMDLSPMSSAGVTYQPFEGREVVVEKLMRAVGKSMDSAHHVSNFLFDVNEARDEAQVSCYALAQHFRLGEGPSLEFDDACLMGNRYKVTVVRDNSAKGIAWKIKRFIVSCMWAHGKAEVLGH